ncbi:hypothetical protein EUGRSUZ_F04437 [Eucalyptus grandis]|uniref:Uncharacterized protein n=2 Tax=Eucalyptus grandis TaxID=71139 RepID=A0ACC3KQ89_EUCGR|nr:hypothetical protein EUGRSUZ_F04437 [Eucalyptus grandis]
MLPSGLNCLQRNFPCNSGIGIYYNFAVKCGGPQITSSSNIVFEMDNNTLGPATYYVPNTERWAVSNVGYFTGNNPAYKASTLSQFTNTLDSELFQTARLSASSLRYYGLGLENGNYNVSLQFAEIQILNTGWQKLGRRLFDVYIQGNLVVKNFDIRKEAVYLIGRICADFIPTVSNNPPTSRKDHTGLIVGVATGVGVVGLVAVLLVFYLVRRRKMARMIEDQGELQSDIYNRFPMISFLSVILYADYVFALEDEHGFCEEFLGIDTRPYTFGYAELKAATDDFNPNKKLGEGGFGPVFKGKNQFVAEIATISAVQHRNLVKLYGCCIDADNRLLVYEYLENKSLDQAMFGQGRLNLDWATRYDICLGIARGLAYLHEESRLRIVHRDVKASNILPDSDLTPKISDFGLAKLYDDNKTHISTRVAGTIGYLAPEYAMRGHLTEKADVFVFGVVALVVVSGRPNSDPSLEEEKIYLLEWAWTLHETNRVVELVDSRLSEFNEKEAKRLVAIGLPMSRVVAMLSGDIEVLTVSTRPGYLTDWRFNDTTSFVTENTDMSTDKSPYNPVSTASTVDGANLSPVIGFTPMLDEIVGEGR